MQNEERNSNQQEYHYKPPTEDTFGDQPQVQDELGEEYLEVKRFDDLKGDGLVAKIDIPESSLIAQFGGFRAKNNRRLAKKYQNPDELVSLDKKIKCRPPFIPLGPFLSFKKMKIVSNTDKKLKCRLHRLCESG